MCQDQQFWWNWWLNFAIAFGTVGAVIIALFGDNIRTFLFPAKLKISLRNSTGELTKVYGIQMDSSTGDSSQTGVDARYYHMIVKNQSKWRISNQTQVFLQMVEKEGQGGKFQQVWEGEVPMEWTHQSLYPLLRPIGQPLSCDLCSIVKGYYLRLHPIISPNSLQTQYTGKTVLNLILQAKGNEGVSPKVKFKIAWDGVWVGGETEMQKHFVIEEIT